MFYFIGKEIYNIIILCYDVQDKLNVVDIANIVLETKAKALEKKNYIMPRVNVMALYNWLYASL